MRLRWHRLNTRLVNATSTDRVHPVVTALDLSRDSRGRETLRDWMEIRSTSHSANVEVQVVWQ